MSYQTQLTDTLIYEKRKAELIDLAEQYHGNLKIVADKANMTIKQLTVFYKDHEDFRKVVDDAKDALYEIAENKLVEKIENGSFQALSLFFSKSPQAKSHGWGEKVEQDQNIHLNDQEKAAMAKQMLGIDEKPNNV